MARIVRKPNGWQYKKESTRMSSFWESRIAYRRNSRSCFPSELESFGLAALEAMACKVVPITTRVGGLPEVIEHGRTGFMAEVGDIETMARYAIDLLRDEKKLDIMGVQARASAQARFCSTKIIPQYEQFYRRVLERSS